MNVTIRNLPEKTIAGLRKAAAKAGRTFDEHVVAVLTDSSQEEAREAARKRRMKKALKDLDEMIAKMPPVPYDSVELIRQGREERDRRFD